MRSGKEEREAECLRKTKSGWGKGPGLGRGAATRVEQRVH